MRNVALGLVVIGMMLVAHTGWSGETPRPDKFRIEIACEQIFHTEKSETEKRASIMLGLGLSPASVSRYEGVFTLGTWTKDACPGSLEHALTNPE
jgi:hypothetical protein